MSVRTCSLGSARNCSHDHDTGSSTRPVIEKVHSSKEGYGVGPADSTGKSSTRYWPGGMRVVSTSVRRRPKKPREIGGIRQPYVVPSRPKSARTTTPAGHGSAPSHAKSPGLGAQGPPV